MGCRLLNGLAVLAVACLLAGCGRVLTDLNAAAVWNWSKEPGQVEEGRRVEAVAAGRLTFSKPVKSWMELKWQDVVRQEMDFSCGSAALATVLQHYLDTPVSEEEIIRHVFKHGDIEKIKRRHGFSLLDIKKFVESRGFTGEGYRMDFVELVSLGKPVIVPVIWRGYDHFVVFKGLSGDRVYLADPAFGNTTMKAESFLRVWKNQIGFVVSNGHEVPPNHRLAINRKNALYVDAHLVNRMTPNTGIPTLLRPEF